MEPLTSSISYPYELTQAGSLFDKTFTIDPHACNIQTVTEDAKAIKWQLKEKISYNSLHAICEVVQKVQVSAACHISRNDPRITMLDLDKQLTNSLFIIPAGKCKRVFVSMHQRLKDATGAQEFVIKESVMLSFDENNRLAGTKEAIQQIVTLLAKFDKENPVYFPFTERRISVMQALKSSAHFPVNFDMVLYKGKRSPKVRIFQERADCDLLQFHNTHTRLHRLAHRNKILICKELVAALAELAEKGFTHRDIKPDNILVFIRNGIIHVKITDFGFACRLTDTVSLRKFLGSFSWSSPELLRKSKGIPDNTQLGTAADIWGLGLIMYIMVKGGLAPFQECLIAINELDKQSANLEQALDLLHSGIPELSTFLKLFNDLQSSKTNAPVCILREEHLQLAFDDPSEFQAYKAKLQARHQNRTLPVVASDLIKVLQEDLSHNQELIELAEKVWPKLAKSLPPSPRTIKAIEDLATEMLQEPEARITISKARQIVESFDLNTPLSRYP